MALNKSKGQMYSWVSHTHSHLGGECPHKCVYCYVDNPRFGRHPVYQGEIRLREKEFKVNYGSGKTIFIENTNDLFAHDVPKQMIDKILDHCGDWPENTYVFQTKNPKRMLNYIPAMTFPVILGCTIETNRKTDTISKAPDPSERAAFMLAIPDSIKTFITIEPILQFDIQSFALMIGSIKPDFLNIGADSKGKGLDEPSIEKIMKLVAELEKAGIKVNKKHNLARLERKAK